MGCPFRGTSGGAKGYPPPDLELDAPPGGAMIPYQKQLGMKCILPYRHVALRVSKGFWGSTLDDYKHLVWQMLCAGQVASKAGILDTRNARFDVRITWGCPNPLKTS